MEGRRAQDERLHNEAFYVSIKWSATLRFQIAVSQRRKSYKATFSKPPQDVQRAAILLSCFVVDWSRRRYFPSWAVDREDNRYFFCAAPLLRRWAARRSISVFTAQYSKIELAVHLFDLTCEHVWLGFRLGTPWANLFRGRTEDKSIRAFDFHSLKMSLKIPFVCVWKSKVEAKIAKFAKFAKITNF